MPIVQSSGMGKSRLVSELSKSVLSLVFTLRDNGKSGYPPGDIEVTQYLKSGFGETDTLKQVRIVGFLAAVAENSKLFYLPTAVVTANSSPVSARLDSHISPQDFVGFINQKMAPTRSGLESVRFTTSEPTSVSMSRIRSEYRKKFCIDVVSRANAICDRFDQLGEWNNIFHYKVASFLFQEIANRYN